MENKVVFCQGTYGERVHQTIECLERILPAVDHAIILVDQTVTEEQKEQLRKLSDKVILVDYIWRDNFVEMRNRYLEEVRKIDPYAWVIVSDPDEVFCEAFVRDLRKILEEAEKEGIQLLLINSHDITQKLDGSVERSVSNFFKNLIFKLSPEVRYDGVGVTKNVHETLIMPPGARTKALPRRYYYEHKKHELEIYERAFRNVYIGGGGNCVGDRNPRWRQLRQICERLGIKSWTELREYLRRGNIDKELLQWIIDCRLEYGWDWQNEMQDCFRYYKALHPEELEGYEIPEDLKPSYGSPPEVMAYVEKCYLEVLGRHADDKGKEFYTQLILSGQIRREDLPKILMQSPEYREKFGEQVKVQVPVDVNVSVSEDLFIKALMQSKTYWEKIKPAIDIGKFVIEHMGKDFIEWFYKEKELGNLTLKEFVKKLSEAV